jgi:hypothetical protein
LKQLKLTRYDLTIQTHDFQTNICKLELTSLLSLLILLHNSFGFSKFSPLSEIILFQVVS